MKFVNPDIMRAEAVDLQKLADRISGDADELSKGALPKDIMDNLKKIEKLAEHLRSQILP